MTPDLDEPTELIIRGDMIDIGGFVSAIHVAINELDGQDPLQGRTSDVVNDVMSQFNGFANIGQIQRDMKRRINDRESLEYRGIDVHFGRYDPKDPNTGEIDAPDFAESEVFGVITKTEEGFFADFKPDHADVDVSLEMASFLRIMAREFESAIDRTAGERDP